jgi:hypothetical protein
MAKPTPPQWICITLLCYAQIFGILFSGMAAIMAIFDLVLLAIRTNHRAFILSHLAGVAAFFIVGCGIAYAFSRMKRRYRERIAAQPC